MEMSYFLAKLIGLVSIIVYGGVLLNRNYYKQVWQELPRQPLLLFVLGIIPLILGLLILLVHNVWTLDWRVLITLIGLIMTLSGIMRLVFPETVLKMAPHVLESKNAIFISSIIMFLIGIYLTLIGFGVLHNHTFG